LEWMDYLDGRKLLAPGSRANLLSNRLVLIAPASSRATLKIGPDFELAAALGTDKLAMANPDAVPAGKYGKQALETLGVWASVERQVARTENVRVALALVSRGEAPLGIVYATDALAERSVRIVGTFPESSHPAIVYPMAIVAASRSSSTKRFVDYLRSTSARVIWERYGFAPAS
jgi:molybdate transport system substrate-binding protein